MRELPKKLKLKVNDRKANNAFRQLSPQSKLIDFASNDYLGFSASDTIFQNAHQYLLDNNLKQNGSTGSRLLTGNYKLYVVVEAMICQFHKSEAALIFNSGYDANLGFFSCVPQREDVIIYDAYVHASIRDGISLSKAKSYKFGHNDLDDLKSTLNRIQYEGEVYIVTESVFSMDGDSPDLETFANFCSDGGYHFIVDEAHAIGVLGNKGIGLIHELALENKVFARLVTFGKALGCHGAAILGSDLLKQYLTNFARPFIYTTALPPHSLATIQQAYLELGTTEALDTLAINIRFFTSELNRLGLTDLFIESDSAIHCCIISGNDNVKAISNQLQKKGFDIKPILSPTVPQDQERLRFCLHAYNSEKEITEVLQHLATFVK